MAERELFRVVIVLLRGAAQTTLQHPFGARGVEHAAGAKARHIRNRLLRGAATFLNPVHHLFREGMAHHPVAAHGGKAHHLGVRQVLRGTFKTE